ncbi:uncharacterized protein BDR25DRAFT_252467 [Lindgomyces ingoldianus]|uniref:Uncharacterized protein n=1 Tax=Lindgomyces ingoldianus TaxID=673940 RepID=A0ACB6RB16_9PLEO|nr:uncharacterized protein BDR25DRAFT_252467 [Lindgomyces ingoldianus]KAF2476459.1 hypothetical protein BDR25DRAFT_252467 [Lindgomyces ingoldianus]
MAEEPQPSTIQEGVPDASAPTGTAEDRKAAAALSALDAHDDEAGQKKDVDTKALGEAMKELKVDEGKGKTEMAEKKKAVKVEAADVTLLVSELELSKVKVTELLRAHDGDAVKAMIAFVNRTA